jgi:hypothetical protein
MQQGGRRAILERPGLLEFAVYALVLSVAAAWVYALPPFTRDPSVQVADIQPTSSISSAELENGQSETATEAAGSDSAAAGEPPVTERQAATAEPADQPRRDPQRPLLVVTARSLNMRAEPNAQSALVGNYPRGALVEPVETSGNWVRVRTLDDASVGWMYASYLGDADTD